MDILMNYIGYIGYTLFEDIESILFCIMMTQSTVDEDDTI